MSKHKTRQQKIIAELHRKLEAQHATPAHTTLKTSAYTYSPHAPVSLPRKTIPTMAIPYVRQDLFKTISVTTVIIVAQLLLYYSLKSHLITIPFVQY